MIEKLGLVLLIVVIGQLTFLCFFLFTSKQGKVLSNRILGIFFLLLAVNLIDLLLKFNGYDSFYRPLALVDDAFVLLYGPLIFLYSYTIIYKDVKWINRWWWHFVPFILLAFFMLLIQNLHPVSQQTQMLEDIDQFRLPKAIFLAMSLTYLHPLIYLLWSYRLLSQYRQSIRAQFSNIGTIDLKWLGFTLNSVLFLMVVAILHALAPVIFQTDFARLSLLVLIIWLLFFVNRWLLKALKHSELFEGIAALPKVKYRGSRLSEDEGGKLRLALERYLEDKKPYLDADLSIDQLANQMGTSAKKLSQVINQSYGQRFYEWVNGHRIAEAKELLVSQPDRTVLEILYQCGYNSKSSFNTFFKKYTGTTPTAFRVKKISEKGSSS
ncbi:MAG: helix-turn-helix domain-containing protein [Cyclobacteriaceae bacterium]|nr:helix-turn-helix domain-containing protein [Cyclobacteriaceae bacterium]